MLDPPNLVTPDNRPARNEQIVVFQSGNHFASWYLSGEDVVASQPSDVFGRAPIQSLVESFEDAAIRFADEEIVWTE